MLNRRYPHVALIATALAVAVSCSGSDATPSPTVPPTATATPSRIASPAPTATATPLPTFDGVEPIVLVPGEPRKLPPGVVLYATDGNWEGPSAAVRRYYRDGSGQVRTDDVLLATYSPTGEMLQGIVGVVGRNGMADIAVALCQGFCYSGALPVTVMRSGDGGVTWADVGTVANGDWATLVGMHGDHVYVRTFTWWGDEGAVYALDAPHDALPVLDEAYVVVDPRQDEAALYTLGEDERTLRRIGAPDEILVTIPLPASSEVSGRDLAVVSYDGRDALQVSWTAGANDNYISYVGFLDFESGRFTTVMATRRRDGTEGLDVEAWLTPTLAIGRASFANQSYNDSAPTSGSGESGPALIDLEAGTISPIEELLPLLSYKPGGPVPVGVTVAEAFARVTNAGTCLNVRVTPSTDAPVLACYADGVLLPVRAGTETVAGETWIAVLTLDGRDGWAAKTYLEVAWP